MQKIKLLAKRSKYTHKGDCGHLAILAGSLGMSGAGCLCAAAALRTGCGLVTWGLPKSINIVAEVKLTEVITKPLAETKSGTLSVNSFFAILDLLKQKDAAVIGPGISQDSQTKKLILKLIPELRIPSILDADCLNILKGECSLLKRAKSSIVVTPHPGEMARLVGRSVEYIQKNRKTLALHFANQYNVTVVLKGAGTIVADSHNNFYMNKTGNPGMATAGSGDVLSGIIGSFLAQGADAFEAAKASVYLHGLAGDIAANKIGEVSLMASDILAHIPEAISKVR